MPSVALLLAVHILAAVFWVGGMAFAYSATMATATQGRKLANTRRHSDSRAGGMADVPLYVNLMLGLGIVMMLIYLHLVFAPWKRFRRAVDAASWPEAAKQLHQIRILVGVKHHPRHHRHRARGHRALLVSA